MRKRSLAFATVAALSMAAPSQAAITSTHYSVTGDTGTGSFSLDFDDTTSAYTLTGFNMFVGARFGAADAVVYPAFGSSTDLALDGLPFGGVVVPGNDGFFVQFDPTAASQTRMFDFTLVGLAGSGTPNVTVAQTGGSGSVTDYSILGPDVAGTFSLDFDSLSSAYSLTALDILVGFSFDETNVALREFAGNHFIDGTCCGIIIPSVDSLFFQFDPTAQTQTSGPFSFTFEGSTGVGVSDLTITQVPPPGVPEPATWAMMLLGFGAVGAAMRRRRVAALAQA